MSKLILRRILDPSDVEVPSIGKVIMFLDDNDGKLKYKDEFDVIHEVGIQDDYSYQEFTLSTTDLQNAGTAPITLLNNLGGNTYFDYYGFLEYTHDTDIIDLADNFFIGEAVNKSGVKFDVFHQQTYNSGSPIRPRTGASEVAPFQPINQDVVFTTFLGNDAIVNTSASTALVKLWYKVKTFGTEI